MIERMELKDLWLASDKFNVTKKVCLPCIIPLLWQNL